MSAAATPPPQLGSQGNGGGPQPQRPAHHMRPPHSQQGSPGMLHATLGSMQHTSGPPGMQQGPAQQSRLQHSHQPSPLTTQQRPLPARPGMAAQEAPHGPLPPRPSLAAGQLVFTPSTADGRQQGLGPLRPHDSFGRAAAHSPAGTMAAAAASPAAALCDHGRSSASCAACGVQLQGMKDELLIIMTDLLDLPPDQQHRRAALQARRQRLQSQQDALKAAMAGGSGSPAASSAASPFAGQAASGRLGTGAQQSSMLSRGSASSSPAMPPPAAAALALPYSTASMQQNAPAACIPFQQSGELMQYYSFLEFHQITSMHRRYGTQCMRPWLQASLQLIFSSARLLNLMVILSFALLHRPSGGALQWRVQGDHQQQRRRQRTGFGWRRRQRPSVC